MSKIIGVTVGTNISPAKIKEKIEPVISVNGVKPDAEGNVKIAITNGKDGVDGKDGYTPVKGVDYFDGKDGKDGSPGKDGVDGKTPVKGTDYFTEADKAEMVKSVIDVLPIYNGEVTTV